MPRGLVDEPGFNDSDEYVLKRSIGNQWVNGHVHRSVATGMDARLLVSGASPLAVFYATKCATKGRELADNGPVVLMVFSKRVENDRHN